MKRAQWQNNDSQTTFEAKNIKCEEREAAANNQNTVFPIDEQIKTDDVILNLQTDTTEEIVSLNNEVQICQEGSDSTTFDNVFTIIEHMDITEPLTTLRQLLEQRLGISLADYTFFLQELTELDSSKTLVHQCVQGEGLVQINVEINTKEDVKKINILDVLKPAEEITLSPDFEFQEAPEMAVDSSTAKKAPPGIPAESEHVTRWIASSDFRQLQEESNIPSDPASWTEKDIKCWITWAMNTFRNSSIDINDWTLSGQELMLITHEEFIQKVPCDPSDVFWTHIELLRKCKIAAVVQQPAAVPQAEEEVSSTNKIAGKTKGRPVKTNSHNPRVICDGCPSMAGGSGQIQLWQFLLELLTDREHRDHIQWIGDEGEFKLINPEIVAQMWGQRKNKPTMNYEKLSRALRYYYDGEMIAKVHGKRFVYKFVCDLKNLLGYSPSTLNRLVTESDIKYKEKMAKQ